MISIEDHQAKLQVLYDKAIEGKDHHQAFRIANEMYGSSIQERIVTNQEKITEAKKGKNNAD